MRGVSQFRRLILVEEKSEQMPGRVLEEKEV